MRITKWMVAVAATCTAMPVLAMDDQATWWRFDGRVEKRLTALAPAPVPPAAAGLLAGAAVLLLPRLGWWGLIIALAAVAVSRSLPGAAGVITIALLTAGADPISSAAVGFFNVLPIQLGSLGRDTAVIVLITGLGLGVLGSWVSVRTYLIR